jgi:hypothetical protein
MKRNNMRAPLIPALFVSFLVLLPLRAASAQPGSARATPRDTTLRADSVAQTDFDPIWRKFQEVMKKNDRKKVAEMISFPFYSSDLAAALRDVIGVGHGPSFTRDEIMKFYDRLFGKEAQKMILSTPTAMPMFDEKNNVDRYIVSIRRDGKGFQWIEFRRDVTTGAWMLARMDSINY